VAPLSSIQQQGSSQHPTNGLGHAQPTDKPYQLVLRPTATLGPHQHRPCTLHWPHQLILCSILSPCPSTFPELSTHKVKPQPNHPASGWAMCPPWTQQHPSCTHGMPSSYHGSAVSKGARHTPVPPRHSHVKVVTNHPHFLNSTSSSNRWMNSSGPSPSPFLKHFETTPIWTRLVQKFRHSAPSLEESSSSTSASIAPQSLFH